MPITVTLPSPDHVLSPWSQVTVSSDFIGPFPSGTAYFVDIHSGTEPGIGNTGIHLEVAWGGGTQGFVIDPIQPGVTGEVFSNVTWKPQTPIHVAVQLVEPGSGTVDSGTAAGTWDATAQILLQPQGEGTGTGLTPEQSLQLSQTHISVFPDVTLDSLTLEELTNGPQGGFVNTTLPAWVFGVIIRIANVPIELTPDTPDGDYWVPSLAVVRVYRGADLWMRVPIHTSSKIVGFFSSDIVAAVASITPLQWILQMTLQVSFRAGVTGQVFLMHSP